MKRPLLIGLTGSIGMGKSTTAQMFADHGIPVWDADRAVYRLYDKGGAAVVPISAIWPDVIQNGAVSRDALKQIIAGDPGALSKIEDIVHPMVAADRAAFIKRTRSDAIVFDIPLLFEAGINKDMDLTIVVTCPADVQRDRVLARGDMTKAQFETIVTRQMPDAQKRKRADYVVETTTMGGAAAQVKTILQKTGLLNDA